MGIFSRRDDEDYDYGCPWTTCSNKDPRFNMNGHAGGVWSAMMEINDAVLAKAKELGVEPPDDIEMSGMKS